MKSIKLCLASPTFAPVYSGPALRFKNYLPGFQTRGVTTEVFSGTPSLSELKTSGHEIFWQGYQPGERLPVNIIDGVPIHCVCLPEDSPRKKSSMYSRSLTNYVEQDRFRPDLIQLLSLPLWAIPSLRRLRRLGYRTVFTHTLLADLSTKPLKRMLQKIYWRLPFELVDSIVVSSGVMRDRLQADLNIKTPIEVIPNGIDINRFQAPKDQNEKQAIRTKLELPKNSPMLISVGPVCPRKGQDLFLQAWEKIADHYPDTHVVFVGPRHDLAYTHLASFHEKIQSSIARLSKPEQVHFTGSVANVSEYLQAADIFVFTSHREGMPNVIPEAMSVGLPVVTTPFSGLPDEFGNPAETFLLVERNAQDLGATIQKLLDQPRFRDEIGQNGKTWIQNTMTIDTSLDKYVSLYRSLL